jgi:hypothetical protein
VPKISVANPGEEQEALVDADLDTLATALYVRTDDLLKEGLARTGAVAPEGRDRPEDH